MIGDLKYGRTVHSLCRLLCLYKNVRLVLISPPELQMPQAQLAALKAAGHQVQTTEDLEAGIEDVQIVYSTRIQTERFPSAAEADLYRGRFRLNQAVYTRACQPNTVIMHPLPRDSRAAASELDQDLDSNPNLAIFRQADNGVRVRMALFALILGVDSLIEKYQREVSWHSAKSRPAE
ncbi:MAG: hypothetical protein GDA55_06785 [Cellvibrionales bacterium]|nr:hypothetical protein [Cellvibrionales bacterium]